MTNTYGLIVMTPWFLQTSAKGTDVWQFTDTEVRAIIVTLNDRPRKRLGYRTPAKVFLGEYSGARIPQVRPLLVGFRVFSFIRDEL